MTRSLRKISYQEAKLFNDHLKQLAEAPPNINYTLYGDECNLMWAEDAAGHLSMRKLSLPREHGDVI